jgi:hypothetical protein
MFGFEWCAPALFTKPAGQTNSANDVKACRARCVVGHVHSNRRDVFRFKCNGAVATDTAHGCSQFAEDGRADTAAATSQEDSQPPVGQKLTS